MDHCYGLAGAIHVVPALCQDGLGNSRADTQSSSSGRDFQSLISVKFTRVSHPTFAASGGCVMACMTHAGGQSSDMQT